MRILFVRHGESVANAKGLIGEPDTPLSEKGREQAHATGQILGAENVTQIISSPFLRARQTAEIIAAELGLPSSAIKILHDLRERRMGDLEGKPKTYETAYYYEEHPEHGLEPQQTLIERMQGALGSIKEMAHATNGTTLVVGHAASGFYMLQLAKGNMTFDQFEPRANIDNAAFVEVADASTI